VLANMEDVPVNDLGKEILKIILHAEPAKQK
jgi:hypothetical protein